MAQREEVLGISEFITPRQARKKPSPPNAPVTCYSSSASVDSGFFTDILQHAVNWLSTGTGADRGNWISWNQQKGFSVYLVLRGQYLS